MEHCRRCNHREEKHVEAGWLKCRGTLVITSGNRVACLCDGYLAPKAVRS